MEEYWILAASCVLNTPWLFLLSQLPTYVQQLLNAFKITLSFVAPNLQGDQVYGL